jgi:hypothetical protein
MTDETTPPEDEFENDEPTADEEPEPAAEGAEEPVEPVGEPTPAPTPEVAATAAERPEAASVATWAEAQPQIGVEQQASVGTLAVTGTGTPPTSPVFGIPRYSANDAADFPTQANAITDILDAGAIKHGTITDTDVVAANKDGVVTLPSLRTLGPGAQQALPGTASSANTASLVDLKPTAKTASYTAAVGDLVIMSASGATVTLPNAPAIPGAEVAVVASTADVTVTRSGTDTIQTTVSGTSITVRQGTSVTLSYYSGVWYGMVSTGSVAVQNQGSNLPARGTLDFTGAGVTASDDPGNNRTLVTIPGGGAVGATTTARMYRNAAFVGTAGGWQLLPLDAIAYDPGGNCNTSTNRYVCPATGYYEVAGEVNMPSGASGQYIAAGIFKNGALITGGGAIQSSLAGGAAFAAGVTDVVQCNAGDYLQLAYAANAPLTANVGSVNTYMSVVQVGNSMNFTAAGGDLTGSYPNPTVVGITGATATTAPAAGGAAALPATPLGYLTVNVNGTARKIAYY